MVYYPGLFDDITGARDDDNQLGSMPPIEEIVSDQAENEADIQSEMHDIVTGAVPITKENYRLALKAGLPKDVVDKAVQAGMNIKAAGYLPTQQDIDQVFSNVEDYRVLPEPTPPPEELVYEDMTRYSGNAYGLRQAFSDVIQGAVPITGGKEGNRRIAELLGVPPEIIQKAEDNHLNLRAAGWNPTEHEVQEAFNRVESFLDLTAVNPVHGWLLKTMRCGSTGRKNCLLTIRRHSTRKQCHSN